MDLAGKRVTVMGLGRFGGGIGVTRWLARHGADVLVTDLEKPEDLAGSVASIQNLVDHGQATLRLGEHNVSDFTTCDLVVANPAVPKPWDNRFIRAAEAAGVPVTTEISLLVERLPAHARERTIGVTGSVGKSTTAAMIHHALGACLKPLGQRVLLGGNIGGSLLDELPAIDERTWLVLELSSAMLYWLGRIVPGWSPRVAVVTNLSANHLDWHGDLAHYTASKQGLLHHQRRHDTAVLGEPVADWAALTPARAAVVDPALFTAPMRLPGGHNRVNAAAASLAVGAAAPDLDPAGIQAAVGSFGGLAHRLQLVCERESPGRRPGGGGEPVRFYNDSKSTTPESCLRAIEAVAGMPGVGAGRVHLIAGGYDKKIDLTPIANAAASLAGFYTIGATGPSLSAGARAGGADASRVHDCGALEAAVAAASARLRPGDVLLLSPGCASWDQFTNFEDRGDRFVLLVSEASADADRAYRDEVRA